MSTIFLLFKKVFLSTFERWRWESIPIIYPFLLCFICGTLKMALISTFCPISILVRLFSLLVYISFICGTLKMALISTSCPISILVQLFSLLVYISFICGTLKMALIPIFCPISILVRLFSLLVYISFIAAIWRWRWFQIFILSLFLFHYFLFLPIYTLQDLCIQENYLINFIVSFA